MRRFLLKFVDHGRMCKVLRHYGVFSGQDFRPASRYDDVLMAKLGHVHLDMPQAGFHYWLLRGLARFLRFSAYSSIISTALATRRARDSGLR